MVTCSGSKLSNTCWKYNSGNTIVECWIYWTWVEMPYFCFVKITSFYFTWQLSTLDSPYYDQNTHFSFAEGTSSFLIKGSSNSSSSLPYFAVQLLLLRILLVFTGWYLNLSGNPVCIILPASQFAWPAGFPGSQLSKPPLWSIRGQCCGSLLQESNLQSHCSHGDIYSWGPMAAGQRGFLWCLQNNFHGFAYPGQCCCLDCVGLLDVISPDGTSPPCSIISSQDSAKCVLHHKPLLHWNNEEIHKPVNWGSGTHSFLPNFSGLMFRIWGQSISSFPL